jgi:hypothetical protein
VLEDSLHHFVSLCGEFLTQFCTLNDFWLKKWLWRIFPLHFFHITLNNELF